MTNPTIHQTPPRPAPPGQAWSGLEGLMSPEMLGLVGIMGAFAFAASQGSKKGILSDGRFANFGEISKARRFGKKQVREAVHNQAALYLGSDQTLLLPDVQRSMAVIGSSGSGKTDSVIDPAIDSAIEQGWTSLIYDVKGTLMKRHAAYAAAHGYDVYVFAPGFAYSDCLNILDFMSDAVDGAMASQIARVLNANLKPIGAREDGFFGPAGDALLKAIFMMAKGSIYPDLLGAWELLSLPDLAQRFLGAKEHGAINSWIRAAANGLMSVANAPETVSGIVGSAVNSFGRLIDTALLPSLLHSTIPLDLPGKQIIFFQIDEQREAETAPLVAMAMHMLVTRNLNAQVPRKVPFFIGLDEFTSIRLPEIEAWINRFREYGMVLMLGYQSDSQLRMRYSSDYAQALIASCGTKAIFSPGPGNTAVSEAWSKACGDKEVLHRTKSRGKGGTSTTEHLTKVPLLAASAIERLKAGECIIFNPGYDYRPYRLRVKRRKKDLQGRQTCIALWEKPEVGLKQKLIERSRQRMEDTEDAESVIEYLNGELNNRAVYADVILPSVAELEAAQTHAR
ncbi:MAG: type IV secretion system DNA-binding domain-containing protein [Thermosynechococcaceae cyanobacterium]